MGTKQIAEPKPTPEVEMPVAPANPIATMPSIADRTVIFETGEECLVRNIERTQVHGVLADGSTVWIKYVPNVGYCEFRADETGKQRVVKGVKELAVVVIYLDESAVEQTGIVRRFDRTAYSDASAAQNALFRQRNDARNAAKAIVSTAENRSAILLREMELGGNPEVNLRVTPSDRTFGMGLFLRELSAHRATHNGREHDDEFYATLRLKLERATNTRPNGAESISTMITGNFGGNVGRIRICELEPAANLAADTLAFTVLSTITVKIVSYIFNRGTNRDGSRRQEFVHKARLSMPVKIDD